MDALRLRPMAASFSLVLGGLLAVVEAAASLPLTFPMDATARLTEMGENLTSARTTGFAFLLSQLFLLGGALGVVAAIRARGAALANAAGALLILSVFAHAVTGGARLVELEMVFDVERYAPLAAILETSPLLLPWLAAGLLGFLFGFIFLAAAVWRSGFAPAWAAWLILGGIVLEFVGGNFSPYLSLLGRLVFAGGVAVVAFRLWTARGRQTNLS